ncbi:sigma-70 family RNA polymerase sigma factor [Actinoplanes subtropicus]|uniref:sigma-70 family RNA polymerase sigma factor n=1 Tax=Actinoplanes subtropicus TaxID=543632 RepID=UPI0004C33737
MTVTETSQISPATKAGAEAPADSAAELLNAMAAMPIGHPSRAQLRDSAIEAWLPLARHLANRYSGRGEPTDDLIQTATVGLIKAVDKFDPDRGVDFAGYAIPTIIGEIKRHFRDRTWSVRVPRRLQELRLAITEANSTLTHSLGRSPTVADIAAHLSITEEDVLEGLEGARAYNATSLATLDEREQKILTLRFYGNLTQSQIAEQIGISQMHVSRLLTKALTKLRGHLAGDEI